MLPPGRARLWTRPIPRGSPTATKTIGMVAVADFKARAGCGPPQMSRSGLRATSSAAKAGRRSWDWAKRPSMVRFRPSIQPWFCRPSRNAVRMVGDGSPRPRTPSRRRVPCAHERRGKTSSAAVAAMNSRRFIVLPHRRGRAARLPTSGASKYMPSISRTKALRRISTIAQFAVG